MSLKALFGLILLFIMLIQIAISTDSSLYSYQHKHSNPGTCANMDVMGGYNCSESVIASAN